ncbi:hypothetical protein MLD38_005592 [Melastoma candidum]|uniref:Uncharacterized protein n=1 Tax=Melastoma candidum TaxID=119954 RepID=A0ACB9RJX1_9MYRT|nr:hypothetical protein MLD38_005592 [Melastoma candidum]
MPPFRSLHPERRSTSTESPGLRFECSSNGICKFPGFGLNSKDWSNTVILAEAAADRKVGFVSSSNGHKGRLGGDSEGSSVEIFPFLKTRVKLPMAIGFMLLYTKLANVLSKEAQFYTVILPFIAFFRAFRFVLYPLSNYIHLQALADQLLGVLGPRFLGSLAIMRIWSFCLFYVMAMLWGILVVSVLFQGVHQSVFFLHGRLFDRDLDHDIHHDASKPIHIRQVRVGGIGEDHDRTVLLATGVAFFSLILFRDPLVPTLAKLGMTPLPSCSLRRGDAEHVQQERKVQPVQPLQGDGLQDEDTKVHPTTAPLSAIPLRVPWSD